MYMCVYINTVIINPNIKFLFIPNIALNFNFVFHSLIPTLIRKPELIIKFFNYLQEATSSGLVTLYLYEDIVCTYNHTLSNILIHEYPIPGSFSDSFLTLPSPKLPIKLQAFKGAPNISGWPWTYHVDKDDLEFLIQSSTFPVLVLQMCSTPGIPLCLILTTHI